MDGLTAKLSDLLQTEVEVGSFRWKKFQWLELKDVLIRDEAADTLLAAGSLLVHFQPMELLHNRVVIHQVRLSNALVRLKRAADKRMNTDFLSEAFATDSAPKQGSSKATPWQIIPDQLDLRAIRFEFVDEIAQTELFVKLKALDSDFEQLDLQSQTVALANLSLQHPEIQFLQNTPAADSLPIEPSTDTSTALTFPSFGWNIYLQNSQLENGKVRFQQASDDSTKQIGFDPSMLDLYDLQWDIRQLTIDSQRIAADILSLQGSDHSGLAIQHLSSQLNMSDSLLALQDFSLKTPHSKFEFSTQLTYPGFNAFEAFQSKDALVLKRILAHAEVKQFRLSPEDLYLLLPNTLPAGLKDDFELMAVVDGSMDRLKVENLKARQGKNIEFKASGKILHPFDATQQQLDLKIEKLATSYARLAPLLPPNSLPEGLAPWGKINLRTQLQGQLGDLRSKGLQLASENGPQLKANLQIKGLPEIKKAQFLVEIDTLQTQLAHWEGFASDSLPTLLEPLGNMMLAGTFDGSIYRFNSKLYLQSEVGRLQADTRFAFEQDYSNAAYSGQVRLVDFELDKILKDSLFGPLTLDAAIDGQGLQPADWASNLKATLSQFRYRNYTYDSLHLQGQLEPFAFEGEASMSDPNLQFLYTGRLPIADSSPVYRADLQIDTIALQALGFYPTPLGLRTHIETIVDDANMDALKANIWLRQLSIQDSINRFFVDSMYLWSEALADEKQRLQLQSPFLQAGLEGTYQLSQLPTVWTQWMDTYFPLAQMLSDSIQVDQAASTPAPATDLRAWLRMSFPRALANIFLPELKQLNDLSIDGQFAPQANRWSINGQLPRLKYANIVVDSLRLLSLANEYAVQTKLQAKRIQSGENTRFPYPTIDFDVQNDSLLFALQSARSTDTIIWGLSGALSSQTLNFRLRLQPNLYINGQQWQLSPDNLVSYSLDGPWQMAQWELSKEREFISLQAVVHSKDSSQAVLAFRDFSISGLSPLLDYPPDYLAGTLNGRAELRDFLTNLNYVADLRLDKWTMDSLVIGNLELRAEQESRNSDILFVTQLADYGNQLGAQGRYQVQDRLLDAEAVIERMEMQSVDKFLPGLIHDSEGFVAGKFRLEGPVDQPKLQGQLQLKEVKTVIDYIKTKYQIEKGSIQITENKIDFGRIQMLDPNNRPALLSGQVNHNFFKDLTADLRFQTDQFQFLNTKSDDNDLFYGQLMLQSDVSIQGPLDQARLVINAKTQPGTDLYVVPLTDKQAIAREDFIIYGQPALDSLGRDTSNLYEQQMGSTGIDLQLNLETTSDASLQIIVDPLSGDQLICKGVSNLTVDVNPGGDVAINGTYQITEGRYSFSYEQLVKRQFDILPNSKITFDGDPLKAGIDITAAYKTRVPIRDLIENQLDIESLANSNQRIDIQVQLKIKGDLIQPELSFDIVLLNDPQGTLADAARNRLAELRTNQTDLSTQVFGLLLFNNFINVQNTGQNLNNAGGNALLSSVSRLISSQLNRLAGKIIKGVDVNVGVDAYQGSTDQVATEVQFGLSKRLFNDRLNVKVGGNLQLSEEQTGDAEPGTFTTFTGDFALEYRLKPDGNYLLRVYRRSDYDALNEGTVSRSGAGISLRKSLKNKKRKRKAK